MFLTETSPPPRTAKVHISPHLQGATFAGPMVVVVTPRTRRRARTLIVLGVALLGFAADQGAVTYGGPPTLRSHMWDLKATMELPTQGSGSWTERESNAGVSKLRELEEAGLSTRKSARERSFAENGIARRNRSGLRRPSGVVKEGRVGKLSPGTLQHKLALQEQELEALRARRSGEEDAVKLGQAEMLLEKIQVRSDECARKPPNSTTQFGCIKEYHAPSVFFARRYIGASGHQPRGSTSSTKTSPSTPRRSLPPRAPSRRALTIPNRAPPSIRPLPACLLAIPPDQAELQKMKQISEGLSLAEEQRRARES